MTIDEIPPVRFSERPKGPSPFHKGLGVGRTVHYVGTTGLCQAAIVSRVLDKESGVVCLHVMVPGGAKEQLPVYYSPDGIRGTWHWPEFVE